ncbi:F-box protein At2g02240 [Cryptomeria japonica]|uniref:F-box protein At2g02240 n=1 Tax=Cryptomeria japonica TaxID=3369 RepID=UPI0027DA4D32|nr:F-box protein At2g02240 [Cryptomeria japonica]
MKKMKEVPENCISEILSFTTPRDACRLAAVSKLFRSAASSDSLWDKWLPTHYAQILANSVSPITYSSKKQLYFHLCQSIFLNGGTQRFWLQRPTGKVCSMLSSREFSIVWGDDERYWGWSPGEVANSSFKEVADVKMVGKFEVKSRFDCRLLSPNTDYSLSFLIKLGPHSRGWNNLPLKFNITTAEGDEMKSGRLLMDREGARIDLNLTIAPLNYLSDGWIEVVAGEFTAKAYTDSEMPNYIEFSMKEVDSVRWKSELFFDGVRIQPTSV